MALWSTTSEFCLFSPAWLPGGGDTSGHSASIRELIEAAVVAVLFCDTDESAGVIVRAGDGRSCQSASVTKGMKGCSRRRHRSHTYTSVSCEAYALSLSLLSLLLSLPLLLLLIRVLEISIYQSAKSFHKKSCILLPASAYACASSAAVTVVGSYSTVVSSSST